MRRPVHVTVARFFFVHCITVNNLTSADSFFSSTSPVRNQDRKSLSKKSQTRSRNFYGCTGRINEGPVEVNPKTAQFVLLNIFGATRQSRRRGRESASTRSNTVTFDPLTRPTAKSTITPFSRISYFQSHGKVTHVVYVMCSGSGNSIRQYTIKVVAAKCISLQILVDSRPHEHLTVNTEENKNNQYKSP